jgi:hypothetical protein
MDWGIAFIVVWVGCAAVVAVDSAYRKTSVWFWRMAGLFGGPVALAVYAAKREK